MFSTLLRLALLAAICNTHVTSVLRGSHSPYRKNARALGKGKGNDSSGGTGGTDKLGEACRPGSSDPTYQCDADQVCGNLQATNGTIGQQGECMCGGSCSVSACNACPQGFVCQENGNDSNNPNNTCVAVDFPAGSGKDGDSCTSSSDCENYCCVAYHAGYEFCSDDISSIGGGYMSCKP